MARRHACVVTPLLTVAFCVLSAGPVRATFQSWKIDQIYSNAGGSVQFVELADAAGGEVNVGGQTLTSNGQTFTFPSDLPDGTPTAGQHMLLATAGYFSLAGVAQADFLLPDHFFNVVGDTLTYAGGLDSVTFSNFQLPIDNVHSLNHSSPDAPLLSGVNSPTNLVGQGGQIPPWENQNNPLDVDGSGKVAAKDVGNLINDLLDHGPHQLTAPTSGNSPPPFLDVNGDNFVKPNDVNTVITFLLDHPVPAAIEMGETSAQAASMATVSTQTLSMAIVSTTILSVPEPTAATLALGGAGLLGFIWMVNQRRRGALGNARPDDKALRPNSLPGRETRRQVTCVESATRRQEESLAAVPFAPQDRRDARQAAPVGSLAEIGQQAGATCQ